MENNFAIKSIRERNPLVISKERTLVFMLFSRVDMNFKLQCFHLFHFILCGYRGFKHCTDFELTKLKVSNKSIRGKMPTASKQKNLACFRWWDAFKWINSIRAHVWSAVVCVFNLRISKPLHIYNLQAQCCLTTYMRIRRRNLRHLTVLWTKIQRTHIV